jgi:hypothetical protein
MKAAIFFLVEQKAVLRDIYRQAVLNDDKMNTADQVRLQATITGEMAQIEDAIRFLRNRMAFLTIEANPDLGKLSADELRYAELVG